MGKIISFANQKGGVGKTTSAVNIAASLGILGYKTLLIDLDPQGNATSGVGIAKKGLKCTIKNVLMRENTAKEAIIEKDFENLHVIPSNMSLAGTEFDLLQDDDAEPWSIMKNATQSVSAEHVNNGIAVFVGIFFNNGADIPHSSPWFNNINTAHKAFVSNITEA